MRGILNRWGYLGALGILAGSACSGNTEADGSRRSDGGASSQDGSVEGADAATEGDGRVATQTPIEACEGEVAPESDPFDFNGFAIDGDTMTIEARGGCSAEEFRLCYLQPLGMSDPPSAQVWVRYEATRVCEPPPGLTLVFGLQALANYASPEGGVLNVTVWNRDESGNAISHGSELYQWGSPS